MSKSSSKTTDPIHPRNALAEHWDHIIHVGEAARQLAGEVPEFWKRWGDRRVPNGFRYYAVRSSSPPEHVAMIKARNDEARALDKPSCDLLDDWHRGLRWFCHVVDEAIKHAIATQPHYGDEALPATQRGLTKTMTLFREVRSCFPEREGIMPPTLEYLETHYPLVQAKLIDTGELVRSVLTLSAAPVPPPPAKSQPSGSSGAAKSETPARPSRGDYNRIIVDGMIELASTDPNAKFTWRELLRGRPLPEGYSEESFKSFWRDARFRLRQGPDPLLVLVTGGGHRTAPVRLAVGMAARLAERRDELLQILSKPSKR
jgi:hypothetical protein